jgi:hypothetical protein
LSSGILSGVVWPEFGRQASDATVGELDLTLKRQINCFYTK